MFNQAIHNAVTGKSKTINFNLLFAFIASIITTYESSIDPKIFIAIQTVLNLVLRFTTTQALEDKDGR